MAADDPRLIVAIEANTKAFERSLKRLDKTMATSFRQNERALVGFNRQMERGQRSAAAFGRTLLAGPIAAVTAALSGREVMRYADAWTQVGRSIESTEAFFEVRLRSQEELARMARETRTDLTALTQLYTRTAAATSKLGIAEAEVARITETVAKALKLGGASASEQTSTLLQLSQALQKGKLDGDEFRSIMENASLIQVALAKRLGVTKGELMNLSEQGKIGVRDLVGALKDIGPEVDRQFGKTAATMEEAFTNLNTSITESIGKLLEMTGAANDVADAIVKIGDKILIIPELFSDVVAEWAVIQSTWDSLDFSGGPIDDLKEAKRLLEAIMIPETGPRSNKGAKASRLDLAPIGSVESDDDDEEDDKKPRKVARDPAGDLLSRLKFEREQLRRTSLEQEIYNNLKKAGTDATTDLGQQIASETTLLFNATDALERQRQAQEDLNASMEAMGHIATNALSDMIVNGAKAKDVIGRLAQSLAQAALQASLMGSGPLAGLFGTSSSGGLFGALLKGAAGAIGGGNIFGGSGPANILPRAAGGPVAAGKPYLVGEKGPELFMPRASGSIVPNGGTAGGGVTINNVIDARGAAAGVEAKIAAALEQFRRGLPSMVMDARSRSKMAA